MASLYQLYWSSAHGINCFFCWTVLSEQLWLFQKVFFDPSLSKRINHCSMNLNFMACDFFFIYYKWIFIMHINNNKHIVHINTTDKCKQTMCVVENEKLILWSFPSECNKNLKYFFQNKRNRNYMHAAIGCDSLSVKYWIKFRLLHKID